MARTRAVLMAALLVPFAGLASPALAQASLAMLDTLDRGGWEVRFRDDNSMRKVCIRSGREFIRLRHSGGNCNRFGIECELHNEESSGSLFPTNRGERWQCGRSRP